MFYVLAIALCLAVLFLVLVSTSLLSMPVARLLLSMARSAKPGTKANLLFAARLLPLGLACVVTFSLALPAFLKFEPYTTKEGVGLRLMALAALGALMLVGMAARGVIILRATRRVEQGWCDHSVRLDLDGTSVPMYRVENGGSLMAVTGVFRPRVFVAREITQSLSQDELRAALAHEMAHASSFDNLKQFLLKITRAPRCLKKLHHADAEWANACEIAADHDALSGGASVLDLSSALIKVGRLKRPFAGREPVASHLVPTDCGSALQSRVTCLSEMLEGTGASPAQGVKRSHLILPVILTLAAYIACINTLLPAVHEALEFLVR